jgi:hypothetical protein
VGCKKRGYGEMKTIIRLRQGTNYSGFNPCEEGGGLLIHPDLFVQTNLLLFCKRYELLSCTEIFAFAV